MFPKGMQINCGKHKPINFALRLFPLLLFILSFNMTPVYADAAQAGMFSALNTAYKWIRRILICAAALSVASYAFSFFNVSQLGSGRDGEKKVSATRSKMIATCIATAAIFLVPNIVKMGQDFVKDFVKDFAWESGSSIDTSDADTIHSSLGGNHIISPADTSDQKITEIEESPEEDEEDDDGGEDP